jgi:dodecin
MATARVTKITSSSKKGFQEAIQDGLKRASATLRNITGLEVMDMKAKVEKGKITEYRATMEITFVLD